MHLTSLGTLSTINRFPEPWIPRVLQHLLETVLMTVTSESFEINAEVVSCGSVFILPSFGTFLSCASLLEPKDDYKISGLESKPIISAIDP